MIIKSKISTKTTTKNSEGGIGYKVQGSSTETDNSVVTLYNNGTSSGLQPSNQNETISTSSVN